MKPRLPAVAQDTHLRRYFLYSFLAVLLAAVSYGGWVWARIAREFDARGWRLPAQVFAAPLDIYAGRGLSADDLVAELRRLGYGPVSGAVGHGSLSPRPQSRRLRTPRLLPTTARMCPSRFCASNFASERIAAVADGESRPVGIAQLEPLLIGSMFPSHGEDRIIVDAERSAAAAHRDAEGRRGSALRHAFRHRRARDVRAALRERSAGEISQGGSTLTMQLVRSYFLSNADVHAQDPRSADVAGARAAPRQRRDHARVRQRDLSRPGRRARDSRLRPREPFLLRQAARASSTCTRSRCSSRSCAGRRSTIPRRNPERALARRTFVLGACATQVSSTMLPSRRARRASSES